MIKNVHRFAPYLITPLAVAVATLSSHPGVWPLLLIIVLAHVFALLTPQVSGMPSGEIGGRAFWRRAFLLLALTIALMVFVDNTIQSVFAQLRQPPKIFKSFLLYSITIWPLFLSIGSSMFGPKIFDDRGTRDLFFGIAVLYLVWLGFFFDISAPTAILALAVLFLWDRRSMPVAKSFLQVTGVTVMALALALPLSFTTYHLKSAFEIPPPTPSPMDKSTASNQRVFAVAFSNIDDVDQKNLYWRSPVPLPHPISEHSWTAAAYRDDKSIARVDYFLYNWRQSGHASSGETLAFHHQNGPAPLNQFPPNFLYYFSPPSLFGFTPNDRADYERAMLLMHTLDGSVLLKENSWPYGLIVPFFTAYQSFYVVESANPLKIARPSSFDLLLPLSPIDQDESLVALPHDFIAPFEHSVNDDESLAPSQNPAPPTPQTDAILGRARDQARLTMPKTFDLVQSWTNQGLKDQALVDRALEYFSQNLSYHFDYQSNIPEKNRVDYVLFEQKKGVCRHFASTFAMMMRLGGVPSRIITGYRGGHYNPDTDELVVRARDAHAWVEVWLPERGWVRVDPTDVVPVEKGIPEHDEGGHWLDRWFKRSDSSAPLPDHKMSTAGEMSSDPPPPAPWISKNITMVALLAISIIIFIILTLTRQKRDPVDKAFESLCALINGGWSNSEHLGPRSLARSLKNKLPSRLQNDFLDLAHRFEKHKFSTDPDPKLLNDLRRAWFVILWAKIKRQK